ncbi:hypothetical protein SLEP1_g43156 [Rubroshorea leprosula]|uniref:Uncharacterized protein n=1 Tax=Rubroshorea leprosula TaxID=152421 RepID=A0AAV5LCH7_9ROSI|nr:hypothetical protein SLEP1_g43156 [Rubroshorea leprosula]
MDFSSLVHLWDPSHECTASVTPRIRVLGRDRDFVELQLDKI